MSEQIERCWENLANAVVLLAVDDYRTALKNLKQARVEQDKAAITNLSGSLLRIEQFFTSKWFSVLTQLDPLNLINVLREEAK